MPDAPRSLRLYDRDRHPPEWTAHLGENEVAVFIRDRKSGAFLSESGSPVSAAAMSCLVFDSLDSAKVYCESLVARRPGLHCEVYDRRGKAVPPIATFPPEADRRPGMSAAKKRSMVIVAVLLMAPTPFLVYIDWMHGGVLLFPTFFGINLFFIALRLVLWVLQSPTTNANDAGRK